jgi:hypothetical protein
MGCPGIPKKEGNPKESSGFPLAVCGLRRSSWYLTRLPAPSMNSERKKGSAAWMPHMRQDN